ncbi:MAG: NYN domain-containing protein, partial [Clostridia bacterium]|nr:NYN domain-containing protein [Clostridia bacterium]
MRTVAVLIDAENVHASFGDRIFSYASSLGDVKAKEIYGVATALGLWVEPVLKYAIHPNLTIKASKFKNTSDISLVIGAMDLLIEGEVDTVIIVSSDSDFSTLSVRLRSAGIEVIGMGTDKVNPLWRTACSSFIVLSTPQQQARPAAQVVKPAEPVAAPVEKVRIPEKSAAVVPPVSQPVVVRTPDKVSKPVSEQEQKAVTAKKQGTPVIELPEPVKAAGSAAATQLKPARPRAAMTHSDRTSSIRNFITKQLEMNGGKMAITNIFHALNNLQDYHVDQQGSKRKPLNYLMWMFGDVFAFEDGMIMFPELSKGGKLKAGSQTETKDQTSEATGSASETGEAGRNPAGEEKPSGQPDNSGKDQQNAPVSPAPGTSGNANTSGGTVKPEGNPVKTPTEMKGVRPVEGTGTSGSPVTAASGTSSVRAAAEAEERPQGTAHEQNVMKPVAAEKPDKGREANDAPAQTAQLTAEPEATQKPESETETAPTQTAQP